jgi:hypothetical protein
VALPVYLYDLSSYMITEQTTFLISPHFTIIPVMKTSGVIEAVYNWYRKHIKATVDTNTVKPMPES